VEEMSEVQLIDFTENPEHKIVSIAKLSRGNSPHKIYPSDEVKRFIEKLLDWGHYSVFEHAYATFYIKGISLNCTHQLVRHRLFSYLQKSRRYCADDPNFIVPEKMKYNEKVKDLYKKSLELYNNLIDKGIEPEDARFVLPTATETEIVVTGNFRNWMHFLKLRTSNHAQWEIRDVTWKIQELLYKIAPNIFIVSNIEKFE
jgi:thymidylate synthase (FAD)